MLSRTLRRLAAAAAPVALIAATTAQAAAPAVPCLTRGEFGAAARYALPSVVAGAQARCAASLPPGAFLRTGAAPMIARLRPASEQAWPQAKATLLRISNAGDYGDLLAGAMSEPTLQTTIDQLIQGLVAAQLPPARCETIDRLLGDIAPLPARNTADLIALFIDYRAEQKGGRIGPLTICPA